MNAGDCRPTPSQWACFAKQRLTALPCERLTLAQWVRSKCFERTGSIVGVHRHLAPSSHLRRRAVDNWLDVPQRTLIAGSKVSETSDSCVLFALNILFLSFVS